MIASSTNKRISETNTNTVTGNDNGNNNQSIASPVVLSKRDKERLQQGYYQDKNNPEDMKLYEEIKREYLKFVTEERLFECYHTYDTQLNKALNNLIARFSPKIIMHCRSSSLWARVNIFIGIQNYGYNKYWSTLVSDKFNIKMSENFITFIAQHEHDLNLHKVYQKELQVKKMRIENYLKKMAQELSKQLNDKKGAFYKEKGGGLENVMNKENTGFSDNHIINEVRNNSLL